MSFNILDKRSLSFRVGLVSRKMRPHKQKGAKAVSDGTKNGG
jgi:hypothetical protein